MVGEWGEVINHCAVMIVSYVPTLSMAQVFHPLTPKVPAHTRVRLCGIDEVNSSQDANITFYPF